MTDSTGHGGPPAEFAPYFALLEAGALVQHGVEAQLRESGDLSFVQFQILAILSEDAAGTQTMTAIADRLVHSRSGLTYQVQQLEKRGLLTRAPSPEDERSTVVALTPSGTTLIQAILPGHMAVVREILLDALDPGDGAELTRLLEKVRQHMRARPPRSATRARPRG
ncbi:MarR family winged helix-turn-helix transcriptional regulator [Blastococcus sp. LR1]|uniref:MarR family winged helix-turn-helix transcriptional regulator n=1 Tax=Blastococcus sp. LR1 TaxID=2877000 RepID=UPI001CCA4A0C|nr:MarR family transcriptional regulator [Blastococcus sp. LR1]MCA0144339.1 MarR family transcriptional regulator [Blastococcus sp. LR1]